MLRYTTRKRLHGFVLRHGNMYQMSGIDLPHVTHPVRPSDEVETGDGHFNKSRDYLQVGLIKQMPGGIISGNGKLTELRKGVRKGDMHCLFRNAKWSQLVKCLFYCRKDVLFSNFILFQK